MSEDKIKRLCRVYALLNAYRELKRLALDLTDADIEILQKMKQMMEEEHSG